MSVDYDLTDLRLFVNVVEAGSITAGAAASHLSLAAASARIAGLEATLQAPLLLRDRRGARTTPAGELLLGHARALLQMAAALRADVEVQAQSAQALVRLVGNSAAVREYVPDLLGDFLAAHPAVNVVLEEMSAAQAVQAVLDQEADIAIVTELTALHGLASRDFQRAGFAVVTPAGHPLAAAARQGPISISQADSCDVVGLVEGSPLQDTWQARARQRGASLNYRVRVSSFDSQVRLIERGVGVALMPQATALRLARSAAVEALPLSDPFLNRRLLLCTRPGAAPAVPVQALLEALSR